MACTVAARRWRAMTARPYRSLLRGAVPPVAHPNLQEVHGQDATQPDDGRQLVQGVEQVLDGGHAPLLLKNTPAAAGPGVHPGGCRLADPARPFAPDRTTSSAICSLENSGPSASRVRIARHPLGNAARATRDVSAGICVSPAGRNDIVNFQPSRSSQPIDAKG